MRKGWDTIKRCRGNRSFRALLTQATVVEMVSAVFSAEKSSTSRKISTASWVAGKCRSAATKASSILSFCRNGRRDHRGPRSWVRLPWLALVDDWF